MPKAYLHVEIEVTDPAVFETYRAGVAARADFAAYGGRYLVRRGDPLLLEGEHQSKQVVIIEFESRDHLLEWYNSPAYTELSVIRRKSSKSTITVLTGTDS